MALPVCSFGNWLLVFYVILVVLVLDTVTQTPKAAVQTTEAPCVSETDSFSCYHCKTNSHNEYDYCGDPFNETHPDMSVVQCDRDSYCAKWVVILRNGALQTLRTCSNQMQLDLKIYMVCMTESGSAEGHLCFCKGELCNAATSSSAMASLWVYVIAFFLLAFLRGGCDALLTGCS